MCGDCIHFRNLTIGTNKGCFCMLLYIVVDPKDSGCDDEEVSEDAGKKDNRHTG